MSWNGDKFLLRFDYFVWRRWVLSPDKMYIGVFKAPTYITVDSGTRLTFMWQTQSKHGWMRGRTLWVLNVTTWTATNITSSFVRPQSYKASQSRTQTPNTRHLMIKNTQLLTKQTSVSLNLARHAGVSTCRTFLSTKFTTMPTFPERRCDS